MHLMPSVYTFYWFLMALSTGLYMLMYVMLFLAALKLKRAKEGCYQIPKGLRTLSCVSGLLGSCATIYVGFQPPPDVLIHSKLEYGCWIGCGFLLMTLPVLFLFAYQKRSVKQAQFFEGNNISV